MRKIFTLLFILAASIGYGQKLFIKDNGQPIDKKLSNTLRYDYSVVEKQQSEYTIDVFFKGQYSAWKTKPWSAYYKIYDNSGNEIYKSEEWHCGGYGGQAENHMVKKICKDLDKYFKK